MKSLNNICKDAGTTVSELAAKLNTPTRTLYYHFSSGFMPYVILHRIAAALGMTIEEVVGPARLADWIDAYDSSKKTHKARGKKSVTQDVTPVAVKPIATKPKKQNVRAERVAAPVTAPAKKKVVVVAPVAPKPKPTPVPSLNMDALKELNQQEFVATDDDEDIDPEVFVKSVNDTFFRTSEGK